MYKLEPETSKEFLRFAERYLTLNKCDPGNHPSLKSCMLRIPGSVNSKNNNSGAEVKIVQEWDGKRPDFRLLVGAFHIHLADRVVKKNDCHNNNNNNNCGDGKPIAWIERLLETPIETGRKYVVDLILAPYFMVERGLDGETAQFLIMEWLSKCHNQAKELDFNARTRTRDKVRQAQQNMIPHTRISMIQERRPYLYDELVRKKILLGGNPHG